MIKFALQGLLGRKLRTALTAVAIVSPLAMAPRADPFVQQMMRDFGARIVPGTIKPVNGTHS